MEFNHRHYLRSSILSVERRAGNLKNKLKYCRRSCSGGRLYKSRHTWSMWLKHHHMVLFLRHVNKSRSPFPSAQSPLISNASEAVLFRTMQTASDLRELQLSLSSISPTLCGTAWPPGGQCGPRGSKLVTLRFLHMAAAGLQGSKWWEDWWRQIWLGWINGGGFMGLTAG